MSKKLHGKKKVQNSETIIMYLIEEGKHTL